jgi:glyoxylase-like metal-dependent hydrolase (beta-lactamase superfamily II)
MADEPTIHTLYERRTGTWQYVVSDPSTKAAVIVDPVLDFDSTTQIITTDTADSILSLVKQKGLRVERILETHVHADHITAASYLQNRLSREEDHKPLVCIGKRIVQVQELFGQRYQIPAEEYEGVFDKLLDDDETFSLGELEVMALHLPGHTPDHMGYMIGGKVSLTFPSCSQQADMTSKTTYFAEIQSSIPILALHALIFLVVVRMTSSTRDVSS